MKETKKYTTIRIRQELYERLIKIKNSVKSTTNKFVSLNDVIAQKLDESERRNGE